MNNNIDKDEYMDNIYYEIEKHQNIIEELEGDIEKYIENCQRVWNSHIVPFINSSDCTTIKYLKENDFHKFLTVMTEHKEYKIMQTSLKRLNAKLEYLMKQI